MNMGFAAQTWSRLLDICGFDNVRFHRLPTFRPTPKQKGGRNHPLVLPAGEPRQAPFVWSQ